MVTVAFAVTVVASQLLSPLLWDHYAMLLLLPTPFVLPAQQGVKGYHDITPRGGVAYDVFGTGKTALKVSLNKYLIGTNIGSGDLTVVTTDVAPAALDERRGALGDPPGPSVEQDVARTVAAPAEIVAPDGQPVRWALNRIHGTTLTDRVYGPELMLRLCRRAAETGVLVLSTMHITSIEKLMDRLLAYVPPAART